ncbi:MAG: BREX-1 system adenine-specific DNA-methyltransferase PglX [Flavobacterium circumlabens]|uniref:BREX-1 system adenine-specific DNA-methyltransferase PglX n=1 Tax=Flavobacterium circumlabens TaxID=2133765 RepID=UPI003265016F
MNTNTLKKFAQEARKKLLEQVGAKLEYVLNTDTPELREKTNQVHKLREAIQRSSKEQIIDKVTYTWFNRFMALRFMDTNDYQPIGIRVLTPKDGYTLPELLDEAKQGNIPSELSVKNQRIYDLLDGKIPSANAQNEAYKELLIGACNHLNKVFPFLFERINDYTELLLPDDLTSELSIIQNICDGMSVEDCGEVEVIGWLYQFYISEKKDEVFASKSAVKKEDIPAATQLFTPRWIVEYMVQNTVGKLWLQNKPNSKLREHMPYFIESPSVSAEDYLKINSVEEITLLDQACGSGHILVYGFDLLYKIYEEEGYNQNEIPELIIKNNLYGFEIDERASQLAGMALMMKARSYNRRFFRKEIEPTILCYKDFVLTKEEYNEAFKQIGINLSDELNYDLTLMQQATNCGSLITPHTSTEDLEKVLSIIITSENTTDAFLKHKLEQLKISIHQLLLLSQKYHCIVDNPPYMGQSKMNSDLYNYILDEYAESKADLMVCFMSRALKQVFSKGYIGMINLPSWMFLSSFASFRKHLLNNSKIDTFLHLGRGIFGSDFGSVAFTLINEVPKNSIGIYRRLFEKQVQVRKVKEIEKLFLKPNYGKHIFIQENFKKIPGFPIGYWLSDKIVESFSKKIIDDICDAKAGIVSGNDSQLIKFWWELSQNKLRFHETKYTYNKDVEWVPFNKGGEFRKYYGNYEYMINIHDLWSEGKTNKSVRRGDINFYYKKAVTWTLVTIGKSSFRISENKVFGTAAPALFFNNEDTLLFTLGLLNSKVAEVILPALNPTVNLVSGDVTKVPVAIEPSIFKGTEIVQQQISISKTYWDARELSWDFINNKLIQIKGQDIEEIYDLFQQFWKNKFFKLHENEEELNKEFIEIYGLQDELTPIVPSEDITILKEETSIKKGQLIFHADEVFAQFISYVVGCMFGRYSLDKEGLILANQGETLEDYLAKVELSVDKLSFTPDNDNIIPVLDDEWFEDDIVGRFYAFLKACFGTANFDKNLAFVEECLGKDIRKYFVKDFYADHIKRYKKRPIYWMFSSPKGSFNIIIYMHRYTPDTLNKILNSYLIEYREKLSTRMEHLDHLIVSGSSTEQTKAQKEKDKLRLIILELHEYERETIRPLAIERINIDLDEGVLVNYNKFGKAIKEVAGLNDAKTKKKVREFDWIDVTTIK